MQFKAISMNLNEIKKPIDNEMGKFKDKLSGSIRSESTLIDTVISYVLKRFMMMLLMTLTTEEVTFL